MSNKQSSIEWLFCELINQEYKNPHDTELINIIEQAKAMHKEEIKEAYCNGNDFIGAEQYYNQTFKNK